MVAIHKKGKNTKPRNYRLISLLLVLGKTFEVILAYCITSFFTKHHILSNRQYCSRTNRFTNDILLSVSISKHQYLDKGHNTFVIALNIAEVFDKVWHSKLIIKLQCLGVNGNLLHLLHGYLQDRSLSVVVNNPTSEAHPVSGGVPQGRVLGPLSWNVYFNDLLQLILAAYVYTYNCTFVFPCNTTDNCETVVLVN